MFNPMALNSSEFIEVLPFDDVLCLEGAADAPDVPEDVRSLPVPEPPPLEWLVWDKPSDARNSWFNAFVGVFD